MCLQHFTFTGLHLVKWRLILTYTETSWCPALPEVLQLPLMYLFYNDLMASERQLQLTGEEYEKMLRDVNLALAV